MIKIFTNEEKIKRGGKTMNKEIEEMILTVPQKIVAYDMNPKGQHLYGEQRQEIAEALYNAGYRKLPEDSVVLSREEYDNLKLELQKAHNKGVQAGFDMTKFKEQSIKNKASKETAEKFAEKLKKVIHERDYVQGYAEIGLIEEIDELLKEYEK